VGTHLFKPLIGGSEESGSRKPLKTEGISGSEESGNRKPLDSKKYETREEFIYAAQHPEDGILVVGEVVSKHQGWSEGALESVNAAVTKRWINNI
jgi:hypothetical protein